MEFETKKKGSILKKLERYLSLKAHKKNPSRNKFTKSKSWPNRSHQVAPNGCFSVYVGAERQRFVIKTEFANHPLFKMLLEDAELEYGFTSDGPLLLPCEVDLFCKVLAEMDMCSHNREFQDMNNDIVGYGSCSPFNLGRSRTIRGYASYGVLPTPKLLKINHF